MEAAVIGGVTALAASARATRWWSRVRPVSSAASPGRSPRSRAVAQPDKGVGVITARLSGSPADL